MQGEGGQGGQGLGGQQYLRRMKEMKSSVCRLIPRSKRMLNLIVSMTMGTVVGFLRATGGRAKGGRGAHHELESHATSQQECTPLPSI